MQATFIPSEEVNSDLGIVNAARVSLGKKSEWQYAHSATYTCSPVCLERSHCVRFLSEPDTKLIHYLAKHNHWTPFGHARLYFEVQWKSTRGALYFYKHANHAGFSVIEHTPTLDFLKGSLYAWSGNVQLLSVRAQERVYRTLQHDYPVYYNALHIQETEPFTYDTGMLQLSEEYVISQKLWKLATATLLVKVPLFVARQVRTSQVGIAYSDLYVEGESFVFNEVSRRYVNSEPEFYTIPQWRIREGTRVKQGSTGIADTESISIARGMEIDTIISAQESYREGIARHIAPEQLRALLPQSMYTEFYMTATLHRWAQWLSLRLRPDVQEETRYIASRVLDTLREQYPNWSEQYYTESYGPNYIGA